MLRKLTPMLETPDLAETISFYTEVLGFSCNNRSDEMGWAHLSKDEVEIMFSLPNAHRNIPQPIMSGSLYLYTDQVEALWTNLKDRCAICYPLETFEYGMREFAVFDNNGYLLQFGQDITDQPE